MHIGTQLVAPESFGSLVREQTYYLLSNRADLDTATLIWFAKAKNAWNVHLISLTNESFESALLGGALVPAPTQHSVPPWLYPWEGVAIDALEAGRADPQRTHRSRAEARLACITPLLTEEFERAFDGARRPAKLFNKELRRLDALAAQATPAVADEGTPGTKTNPAPAPDRNCSRQLLWYCTYRVFGQELSSLLPAYPGLGCWSRTGRGDDAKPLGRPPTRGQARHRCVDLAPRIQAAYKKLAELGVAMTTIHRQALSQQFGCLIETLPNGQKRDYHPQNLPFPPYQGFRHWVIKKFGLAEVQRIRYGEVRYRSRCAPPQGSFSQDSANYMEKVEGDLFYLTERPSQLLGDGPGPRLGVCRLVDNVSGTVVGVGFSAVAERAEAYLLAKFCAVVSAELLIRLFNLPVKPEELPPRGLPPHDIVDRGAGASTKAKGSGSAAPAFRELAPSYQPQSKATVEGSHPRSVALEGAPSHVISDLNQFNLVRRELLRMIADNQDSNALPRLTPRMLADRVAANPLAITRYLVARGRTCARPMSDHEAIRKFLRPMTFRLDDTGLWLRKLRFADAPLRQLTTPLYAAKGQALELRGFAHPFALLLAWVEVGGRLIEVQPILRLRDDPEQLQLTCDDLEQLTEINLQLAAEQRLHGPAARRELEDRYHGSTGQRWDAGRRMAGRRKALGSGKKP